MDQLHREKKAELRKRQQHFLELDDLVEKTHLALLRMAVVIEEARKLFEMDKRCYEKEDQEKRDEGSECCNMF
jgi:hypothetical protein